MSDALLRLIENLCMRLLLLFFFIYNSSVSNAQELNYLFRAGDSGYKCFRIPAIVKSNAGTLLAFAEARKSGCGDAGNIDLVVRRSSDNGKTWSPLQIVWDDDNNTCGNPAPVVDEKTGKVVLLSTWNLGSDHESMIINQTSKNTRRIFVLSSMDDGHTWTTPKEITGDVKRANWTWYATGPVNGIQLKKGKNKGRMIIPCDHIEAETKKYFSHTIHSDDAGETWKLGGSTPTDQVNESTVAELSKGRLLLNMRNYNQQRVRQTSISKDGGETWSALKPDTALIEPVCQASLIRIDDGKKPVLAFSNPANTRKRAEMTVRLSYDQGKTWPRRSVIWEGPAAYSNLVKTQNGRLACFFEGGIKSAYEGIAFTILDTFIED